MKKLSICIPTYNRADVLDITLGSLVNQLIGYEDEIELIISDNCSEDHTEEVVMKHLKIFPLIYHKMDQNIGGNANFDYLISNLSNGEYSILIGDDDLILSDSIIKLMKLIENSKYEYIYINHCYKSAEEIIHIIKTMNGYYNPSVNICECFDFENKEVSKWEEILNYKGLNPGINMLYIGAHLFKKELWRKNRNIIINMNEMKTITSIEKLYGKNNEFIYECFAMQVIILSKAMMGKSCYYCGEPLIIQGLGTQEFGTLFSQCYIRTMHYQLKHFKQCGIDEDILSVYKESVDEIVLLKLAEIMNYKRDQMKNKNILEYIHKNIYEENFFEKMFDKFSNNQGNHYIKVVKGVFNSELIKYLSGKQQNIVLWGTGDVAKSLINNIELLKEKITIVVDSSLINHGKKYELLDIEIESPTNLEGKNIDLVIVSTVKYADEVINFLETELKLKTVVLSCNGIINIPR